MTKKILALLFTMIMLLNLCACGSDTQTNNYSSNTQTNNYGSQSNNSDTSYSEPSYCGTWVSLSDDRSLSFTINSESISIKYEGDGETEKDGPYSYTESKDANYTYLEFDYEGSPIVVVVLNDDMIAYCFDYPSNYIGITPNGTKFDADIRGNWLFREGAGTTDVSSDILSILQEKWDTYVKEEGLEEYYYSENVWEMFVEEQDFEEYYYYENAKVIATPDNWGVYGYAVTADGDLSGMEGITLVGLGGYGDLAIMAKGNFIITDNT